MKKSLVFGVGTAVVLSLSGCAKEAPVTEAYGVFAPTGTESIVEQVALEIENTTPADLALASAEDDADEELIVIENA